ncbi:MAG TPA: DUF58 domain-containing protein, partial [Ilumatobacteraceae bacterium]|nr:DUF58 domain-containing protein [Ilumatobacteraceae bacterium]
TGQRGDRPPIDVARADALITAWPSGPPSASMAEMLRTLEVTINRRLDGVLHGNHQGLTPGHGSEPGEARVYQPGDDVRRIDWNVTARTQQTHIRELIADRDLEAWLVVDASAAMRFGTEHNQKAQIALAAAAAVGFLTARNQNRLGAILVAGPDLHTIPPRGGRTQVQAILSKIAAPAPSEGRGRADLAGAIDRVGAVSKRRGFVAVIADFVGSAWVDPLARLGLRHDLLAIMVSDPREFDIPPIGLVEMVDPATGSAREVRVTASVQRRFADLASKRADERRSGLRRAGCELIELSTGDDWLGAIVSHVHRRRRQAVRGDTLRR